METILILGAGRSSSAMISYLLQQAEQNQWQILVGDFSEASARERIGNSPYGKALAFDIHNRKLSKSVIEQAKVVISLLPPHLHIRVAELCLELNKHLLTASYVSAEMKGLHDEAKNKKLLFLNECGLDPGIDHMSAMQVIDRIKSEGGKLLSFESFTGGLIAPETEPENPWRYKFTWNPRNVVMAGQGTAKYLQDGKHKYIPYQQLFKRTTQVNVTGYGSFEGYANRDSLSYIETYNLHGIQTMLRGTLRSFGFCDAWNILVQLGCCDDTYMLSDTATMTHLDFINSFLGDGSRSAEQKIANQFDLDPEGPEIQKLRWSGFFDDTLIEPDKGTPAQIVESILNRKWKLYAHDKDMIVMYHRFVFEKDGSKKEIQASLVVKGDNAVHTAMAKTVGLPLGIAARLLLLNKISERGVCIPISPEFYNPILAELKTLGVELDEKEVVVV